MQWLAALCVNRPVFATVLILSLTVIGAFSFTQLGVDRFPKVDFPTVVVTTVQPGAAPEQIETEITDKIEEAVNTISGIDELRSISSEGVSQVIDRLPARQGHRRRGAGSARQGQRRAAAAAEDDSSSRASTSSIPDAAPVLSLALSANKPVREITEYADKVLRRQLESVNGVGQVLVLGGRQRQINVWLDADRLRAYNLTVTDVVARAAVAEHRDSRRPRRPGRRSRSRCARAAASRRVAEFNDIVVREKDGHPVRDRRRRAGRGRRGRRRDDRQRRTAPATVLLAGPPAVRHQHRRGRQRGQASGSTRSRRRCRPATTSRVVRDTSEFIEASIHNVEEHLIVGSILAALVVLLFLGNLRSTIIAAIAIPTSIIATFGLIWYMGFTLNMMTMLALTLAVGIVIDDAIVVLENIYRFIEEKHEDQFHGRGRGDEGDRPGGARDDAVAGGDLRAGRLHGRHRRPLHEELRPDDGVRDHGVAARQLHADADAVGALAEGEAPRQGRALRRRTRGCSTPSTSFYTRHARVVDGAPRRSSPASRCWCCCRACRCS